LVNKKTKDGKNFCRMVEYKTRRSAKQSQKWRRTKQAVANQINFIWVSNLMHNKPDLNPTAHELLDWIVTGQIDAMRK
jgi:hypothetical protein